MHQIHVMRILLGLLFTTILFACSGNDEDLSKKNGEPSPPEFATWTSIQGNERHTGFVPLSLDVANFSLRWEKIAFDSLILQSPLVADGKVFIATPPGFYSTTPRGLQSRDAINGQLLWQKDFSSGEAVLTTSYFKNAIYYVSNHGYPILRAVNASDGGLLFEKTLTTDVVSYSKQLVPSQGNLYLTTNSYPGFSYAFSAQNGNQVWSTTDNTIETLAPAVDDNYVYSYSSQTKTGPANLLVKNKNNGILSYSIPDYNFISMGNRSTSVALGFDQQAVVVDAGRIVCFDLANKTIAWESAVSGYNYQPAIAPGYVFAHNVTDLSAFNIDTGVIEWTWATSTGLGIQGEDIIATNNLIFVHDSATTYAIDRVTHLTVWSYPASGHLVLTNQGALYIATATGKIISINTSANNN